MRGWTDLGVVETIYEEDHENFSASPSLSSPSTPLHSRVEAWSLARGRNADVLIRVEGLCFRLHKDRLVSRSGYLKRQLTEVSEITLAPPLNITAQTFTLVANFCYGTDIVITPFNVAALRTAAELLEMSEGDGHSGDDLRQITETYFRRAVAVNREYASIVFRSCLKLLPEAEETAALVSRCIEVLSLMDDGDSVASGLDDVKSVCAEDFQMIVNSLHCRLAESHDLLYGVVDYYLKEQNGKITEEQRTRICNSIDCNKLSPQLLMHAVQNHRMPLRFIVRAMLVEQLNTRRSIFSAAEGQPRSRLQKNKAAITLGAILQRDAALRQVAQLKVAMDATCSRIQSLEKDLHGMRKLLHESETRRNALESEPRSVSFRLSSTNKVQRGERGSASSASLRFSVGAERGSSSSENSCNGTPRAERNIGRRFLKGLRSAFRLSTSASKRNHESRVSGKVYGDKVNFDDEHDDEDGNEDVIVVENDWPARSSRRSVV